MTDNTRLNPGQGGDLVATDDISGVKHQKVLVEFGAEGVATRVTPEVGLPVDLIAETDNPAFDGFGRFRISQAATLGDFMQPNNAHNNLVWTSGSTGSGSFDYSSNRASTTLNVHTGSGDERIWQTKRKFQYQPGLSFLITMTAILGPSKADVRRRLGYFNEKNGLYLQLSGSTVSMVRRNFVSGSVDEEVVDQADWNLDTLDGLGPSGEILDVSKVQIFMMDFQWLGAGRVRTGFFMNGHFRYAHEFTHANALNSVYMSSPNLPIRFEIINEAETASPTALEQVCFSVMSEGEIDTALGIAHTGNRGIATANIGTTLTPLISVRLGSEFVDESTVVGIVAQIVSVTSTTFLWEARLNPVISDAPSWMPVSSSAAEIDIVRSGSVVGGQVLASGYGVSTGAGQAATTVTSTVLPIKSIVALASELDGTPDELVIVVQNTSGTDDFVGALTWREFI